jgi:acetolactate synthase-1/2/3 large subunit
MMAEAYGKLTGRPGVCMVTRGPGATNAASGVHVAFQDSTPMILIVGQVGRAMSDREAFQEMDYRRVFGQMAKWVAQVDDPARIPEYLSRAYHVAVSGRPGPVVLAFPEYVLSGTAATADAKPATPAKAKTASEDVESFRLALEAATRPMLIVGGGGWSAEAAEDLQRFSERNHIPVCTSFRCQDYFDNRHKNYCGHAGIGIHPKTAARIRGCDLLVSVGARLGEITSSGYAHVEIPNPQMTFVHVYPSGDEIGHMYRPDLAVASATPAFARSIVEIEVGAASSWKRWTEEAAEEYRASTVPRETPGALQLEHVVTHVGEELGERDIVTNGAGNYAAWVNRYYPYRGYRTQLAPTSGSMGYGLPAAISAALLHSDREVVCFAGDGCFLMTGQELSTAVRHELGIVVIVANNGMYGTIRMHQERNYPGRVHGTDLANPDFAKLAESYGALGLRAESNAEFDAAFERARKSARSGRPALIEVIVDPEALTPAATLSEVRAKALGG